MVISPTNSGTNENGSLIPKLVILPAPNVMPPNARPLNKNETLSNFNVLVGKKLSNTNRAQIKETTINTLQAVNTILQLYKSIKIPESVGAITGAKPIAKPYQPITVPCFSRGYTVSNITCAIAPKIPPLAACNTRPPIIVKNVWAIALIANPIIINTRLTIYKRFVDTLLIKNADNGIIIALAKAKPLVTHCPIPNDTFKSFVMCGNAITIAVANKDAEKDVIIKRYGLFDTDEVTQKEIAKELGISRSYVSRIEKRALTKMLREFIKNKNHTF